MRDGRLSSRPKLAAVMVINPPEKVPVADISVLSSCFAARRYFRIVRLTGMLTVRWSEGECSLTALTSPYIGGGGAVVILYTAPLSPLPPHTDKTIQEVGDFLAQFISLAGREIRIMTHVA